MHQNSSDTYLDKIDFILGNKTVLDEIVNLPSYSLFNDNIVSYLNTVSKIILKNKKAKDYPDVMTFGFWCRKTSILEQKQKYFKDNQLGRGVSFHVAPSNVPVNFAYSLVVGLLAGNACLVRLSSKKFVQIDLIVEALREALREKDFLLAIAPYICLIRYDHDKEITDYLSMICDSRIIWGGDNTIVEIRKSPLKPRANEITFADRYSICIIESDTYLLEKDKQAVALKFFNDTYLTDQNACTSPMLIVWLGKNIVNATEIFWRQLALLVNERYILQPAQSVNKLLNLSVQSATNLGVNFVKSDNNSIYRVKIDELTAETMNYKCNSGYFMEYCGTCFEDLLPIINNTYCQTLCYYGVDINSLKNFILQCRPKGVDRVVPIGETMNFTLTWDGYNLINQLSREIFYASQK